MAVSWRSKKQQVTFVSSAEAEYRALADASCEIIWFLNIMSGLKVQIQRPVSLFCDNKVVIDLTTNPVYHARTKHIELNCHLIREKIQNRLVAVRQYQLYKILQIFLQTALVKFCTGAVHSNWDSFLPLQFVGRSEDICQ